MSLLRRFAYFLIGLPAATSALIAQPQRSGTPRPAATAAPTTYVYTGKVLDTLVSETGNFARYGSGNLVTATIVLAQPLAPNGTQTVTPIARKNDRHMA